MGHGDGEMQRMFVGPGPAGGRRVHGGREGQGEESDVWQGVPMREPGVMRESSPSSGRAIMAALVASEKSMSLVRTRMATSAVMVL